MVAISFNQLTKIKNDGLVFYGLADDLKDFQEIINNEFNEKNLGSGSFEDKFKGIFGCRNFLMESPDKEVLAYADSRWFYFDSSTGQPTRIDEDEKNAYPIEPAYDMNYSSRKINCPDNLTLVDEVTVCQNYLDTNHHVNNGQYVRLAVNALPIDYKVKELRAEFRLAAKMGDTMYVRTAKTDEHFYVIFTDEEENPYFLSEFTSE